MVQLLPVTKAVDEPLLPEKVRVAADDEVEDEDVDVDDEPEEVEVDCTTTLNTGLPLLSKV